MNEHQICIRLYHVYEMTFLFLFQQMHANESHGVGEWQQSADSWNQLKVKYFSLLPFVRGCLFFLLL